MGGIVAMVALALPAGAQAESQVDAAITEAVTWVSKHRAGCELRVPEAPAPGLFDGTASAELTSQMAVFRRPQTEADLASVERMAAMPLVSAFRSSLRIVQGADGRAYELYVRRAFEPRRGQCMAAERRALKRVTRDMARADRRAARAELSRRQAFQPLAEERVGVVTGGDGVWGTGLGVSARELREGFAPPSLQGGGPSGAPTRVVAPVPDGVASVTWSFEGGETVTARVQDNLAVAETPTSPLGLVPARVVQRDAAGAVLTDVSLGAEGVTAR